MLFAVFSHSLLSPAAAEDFNSARRLILVCNSTVDVIVTHVKIFSKIIYVIVRGIEIIEIKKKKRKLAEKNYN